MRAGLADAIAGDIQFVIESAIDARGSAVIALAGGDPTAPAFRLPFQDLDTDNHIAQWTEVVVPISKLTTTTIADPPSTAGR